MFEKLMKKFRKTTEMYKVTYSDGMVIGLDKLGVNNAVVNDFYGEIVNIEKV